MSDKENYTIQFAEHEALIICGCEYGHRIFLSDGEPKTCGCGATYRYNCTIEVTPVAPVTPVTPSIQVGNWVRWYSSSSGRRVTSTRIRHGRVLGFLAETGEAVISRTDTTNPTVVIVPVTELKLDNGIPKPVRDILGK